MVRVVSGPAPGTRQAPLAAEPEAPAVWLITGVPGAGKSTVARLLGERLGRAAHIEGDRLQDWIVAGAVAPGEEPEEESLRQMELCIRNQCLLARSYAEAGFTPLLDYVVVSQHNLNAYRGYLRGGRLYLVVLAPPLEVALARDRAREEKRVYDRFGQQFERLDATMREELAGEGLWLDTGDLTPGDAVAAALGRQEEARIA